jgi:hypothetical protein
MRSLRQLWVVAVILAGMFGGRVDGTLALRRALFSSGEPGLIYNPNKLSTLFQDAACTVPVTAVNDPVGGMLDVCGRGNLATQVTSTARPLLKQDAFGRYYLQSDGADDFMLFPSLAQAAGQGRIVAARVKHNQTSTRVVIGTSGGGNYLGQVSNLHQWRGAGIISSDVPGSTLATTVGYYGSGGGGFVVNGVEFPATGSPLSVTNTTLFGDGGTTSGAARLAGVDFYGAVVRTADSTRAQADLVAEWLDEAR